MRGDWIGTEDSHDLRTSLLCHDTDENEMCGIPGHALSRLKKRNLRLNMR
jgi:hypothetical protein